MRSVTVRTADLKNIIINLGFVGENEHRQIRFDAKKDFEEYPNASASLTVVPPEGESYPAIIERDGDFVLWTITDSDVIGEGDGEIQLAFTENEVVKRTCIGRTKTDRSLVPTGSIPSGIDDFITRAGALLEQVEDTFPAGGTTGQVLAKKSDDDYDTEWVDQGAGGTSDYDELENRPQIGGVTLTGNKTLHDLGAASEADVEAKYTKPETGIPASDLAAGVIPDPEDLIDDTAGEGDTDKVWSADKSHALLTEITQTQEDIITEGRVKLLQDNEWGADRSATATGRSYSVSKNVVTKAQASASTAYRYALIFGGDTIKSPADSNIETLFSALDPTTDFIAIPAYQSVSNRNVILQFIVDLETSTGGTANPEIFRIITADSQGNISEANAVTIPQLDSKANKAKGIIEINLNDYAPSVLTNGKMAIVDYSRNSAWEGTVTVNLYLTPRFGNTVKDVQINGTSVVTYGVANIPLPKTQSVSGSTPSITGVADTRYVCGECATLSITAPASGCIDILFESGSTPTVLTVSSAKTGVTAIKWANGFDPTSLDANTTYELNILDGEFGVVGSWT